MIFVYLLLFNIVRVSGLQYQTPTQQKIVEESETEAKEASRKAFEQAAQLFSNDATYRYLQQFDDGSGLFRLSPTELSERFWGEVGAAELVHNFGEGVSAYSNCGFDIDISMGESLDTFLNQWQLQARDYVPVDTVNNQYVEWSETSLFHFPPFVNVSSPDLQTASSRPFYAALNMYRGSGGNPQCGGISAVLSSSYLNNQILAAPLDTGYFTGQCSEGQSVGTFGDTAMAICAAWPEGNRPLGVPPYYLHHLLQPYLYFYNQTQAEAGEDYPFYNLARLIIRLLSRNTYQLTTQQLPLPLKEERRRQQEEPNNALSLNFIENTLGYFEFNPVMSVSFPSGVKFMIGMFELYFGTEAGRQLKKWCISKGWPLVWAYNPEMSFFRCGPDPNSPGCAMPADLSVGIDLANVRVLDLEVLRHVSVGYNISIPTIDSDLFIESWKKMNVSSISSHDDIDDAWNTFLRRFARDYAVEPVYSQACDDIDACIGVTIYSKECVCSKK